MSPVSADTSFYPVESLVEALEAGTLVLTPNHRLARRIKQAWGRYQSANGVTAWLTPRVMSLDHWWQHCYRHQVWQGSDYPGVASSLQQRILWRRVVEQSEIAASLLRPAAAADLAQSAHQTLLLWELNWRSSALRQSFEFYDDSRLFLSWADNYEQRLQSLQLAQLEQVVPRLAGVKSEARIVLAEFTELPPLYRTSLAKQSEELVFHEGHKNAATCRLTSAETRKDEIEAAACWARSQHADAPDKRLAILVPDLHSERQEVERILRREFHADARRPDTLPVNFSAGVAVSRCPPVQLALSMLWLCCQPASLAEISALLSSRYRSSEARPQEMTALRELLERGREPISLGGLRAQLQRHISDTDARLVGLAQPDQRALHQRYLPSLWRSRFHEILAEFGWPGPGPMDSLEYQQLALFYRCLDQFASLDTVLNTVDYREALAALEQICSETVFQAETPDAPIQILGLLEAAGLAFDAVWVCGMASTAFPAAANPNPLIPLSLQRSAGMPHADASRELAYADKILQQLRQACGTLVASFARLEQGVELSPSALVADFEPFNTALKQAVVERSPITWVHDARGPTVTVAESGSIRGGSALLADQSQCPFRAFARHRLHAHALPDIESGLSAAERGSLLHDALYQMWGVLEDSARLQALTSGEALSLAETSAAEAIASFRGRRDAVTLALLDLEQERLISSLSRWLEVERQREPFRVIAREQRIELSAGPLTLQLQLDRIDQLASGGKLLIDYKTSNSRVTQWFGERLEEPQLPLYGSTVEIAELEAVSFAVLRQDVSEYRGVASTPVGPGISTDIAAATRRSAQQFDDWSAVLANWQRQLDGLIEAFLRGDAAVDPIDRRRSCQYCGLEGLCRVT